MQAGGAERVLGMLADHWAAEGREVTLLTIGDEGSFYPLRPEVRRAALHLDAPTRGAGEAALRVAQRVAGLRRELGRARPDAVVAFLEAVNTMTLLASVGAPWRVVVSERNAPGRLPLGRAWELLGRSVVSRADAIVMQSGGAAARLAPAAARRAVVVPNPVRPMPVSAAPREHAIVAVGRLEHQKGMDLLVDAFARIADRHPGWRLEIWGEGRERPALERRIADHGLGGRAALRGRTTDPEGVMARAGLFVLPSRFEGFPNVLAEAMATGAPVVAADCEFGPRELIRPGVDGVLVPCDRVDALADAMASLLADEPRRRAIGGAAPAVAERFGAPRVLARWTAVVDGALAPDGGRPWPEAAT